MFSSILGLRVIAQHLHKCILDIFLAKPLLSSHPQISSRCCLLIQILECVVRMCRSYGVLLWEIVTYGAVPLAGMSTDSMLQAANDHTLLHNL